MYNNVTQKYILRRHQGSVHSDITSYITRPAGYSETDSYVYQKVPGSRTLLMSRVHTPDAFSKYHQIFTLQFTINMLNNMPTFLPSQNKAVNLTLTSDQAYYIIQ